MLSKDWIDFFDGLDDESERIAKNLIYISFILFAKEIILLLFRSQKIKTKIENLYTIYSLIIMVSINLIISIKYEIYFIYSYLIQLDTLKIKVK